MEMYGLTSGTVSYAMNILSELGAVERRHGSGVYVRSTHSSAKENHTQAGLFALVVPEIESGLYLSLQAGMQEAVGANREQLITMTTSGSTIRQADAMLQLIDRGVAGIALVPCYETSHAYQLRHLHRCGIPLVLLHRGVPGVPAPAIKIPFNDVGELAGRTIGELGHKSVAVLVGPASEPATEYLEGFRSGLARHQVNLADDCILFTESMLITAKDYAHYGQIVDQFLTGLFSRSNPPTAIFCTFDRLAEMVFALLAKNGIRMPNDLSILSFAGNRRAGPVVSRLATVAVDEFATGRQAYELLASMHRGERPIASDEAVMMPICLDRATTLGPPPKRTHGKRR
jgi:LacI family transcriptional regulator